MKKIIFTVLHELKLAAGSRRDCVVIMGDRDKVARAWTQILHRLTFW